MEVENIPAPGAARMAVEPTMLEIYGERRRAVVMKWTDRRYPALWNTRSQSEVLGVVGGWIRKAFAVESFGGLLILRMWSPIQCAVTLQIIGR